MAVRNEEKKAFRDLTPEERGEIVEALLSGNAEAFGAESWHEPRPIVAFDAIYRTRPRQLVIPWEVIKPEYKWAAMDENGALFVYKYNRPSIGGGLWLGDGSSISALNINTTGIDWRESLTERP